MNSLRKSGDKDEIIRELEAQIQTCEKIMEKIKTAPKHIAKVIAGPEKEGEATYYRCEMSGQEVVVSFEKEVSFKRNIDTLEPGTEVLLVNGLIVAIMPDKLKKEEKTPEFILVDWKDVGGLKSQIETIRDTVEIPIKHEKLVKEMGLSPSKGILLYGPPGCGKTLVAKAIASSILGSKKVDARAFIYIKGAELLSMYVGATEKRISHIFRQCREFMMETNQRAILFIDEAEAILPKRGSGRSSDVEKTIVPTFLAEMDGFEGNNPFVLLSTNLPENIDEAVLREGRIDLKIEIKRPTIDDCYDIFEIHLKKVKCCGDVKALAEFGKNQISNLPSHHKISGSMIETIVKFSTQSALKRVINNSKSERGVVEEDIRSAIEMLN